MAWNDEALIILRTILGDNKPPGTQTYSDEELTDSLLVGALQTLQKAEFTQTFRVNVGTRTISPDPSDEATRDESLLNLMTLRAACIAEHGEMREAVRQGIAIKDGSSSIDLRDIAKHRLALLEKGFCKTYDEEMLDYQTGGSRIAGAAVIGPFRAYAHGNPGAPGAGGWQSRFSRPY